MNQEFSKSKKCCIECKKLKETMYQLTNNETGESVWACDECINRVH